MDSKENFISIMIHELRSPVDSIKKVSEVMRNDSVRNDKERYSEYVQMIYKSSSYALELINNFLAMSRIDTDRLELSIRPSNIKQIIEERARFFNTDAETKGVKIAVTAEEDIPESLEFDPTYITQVLNNLLSNALKFTEDGGHITMQVFVYKKGEVFSEKIANKKIEWFVDKNINKTFAGLSDCVIVGVTDSGSGISEIDIDKLFTKSTRLKDLSHDMRSLGLDVVKGIIEAHDGVVGVSSRQGEGSTFYFTLNIQ